MNILEMQDILESLVPLCMDQVLDEIMPEELIAMFEIETGICNNDKAKQIAYELAADYALYGKF